MGGADEEPATDEEPLETSCQQRGDVNGDGEVNSVDAALILQLNAGLIASLPCQEAADVNGDGAVTSEDAALILQFTAGFIESFPPDIPPDTEDDGAVLESSDAKDDATDCNTGAAVDDPAVDISGVNVSKVGETIVVEVVPVQSPETSLEDFSFAIIVLLFGFEGLAEIHAGLLREGLIDSDGSIIPGSEGQVTWTDGGVGFTFPNGDSIPKGSPLEVRAFHTETEGGAVNCDTFEDVYSCFGRCDD